MKELTAKQQRVYDYILSYISDNGYPPSIREIAAAVGVQSPSTIHFHLKALEEAGVITRGKGKTRAITAVRPLAEPDSREEAATEPAHVRLGEEAEPEVNQVPVLGNVAAGSPILAEECIEDYLTYDTGGRSGEHFALRIRGDSMLNAGILPGDLVVVHRQSTAENGEIVIALLDTEATCKRLRRRDGRVWLVPENDDYQPIDGTHSQLLGKVVALVREYS